MQKNCAYCGSSFSFQRDTKKYCSDNCKQMAYFSRNGFIPAHGSITKSAKRNSNAGMNECVSVKDVKYLTLDGAKNDINEREENAINEREIQKVMEYAKCLIRNLLHLADYRQVERETIFELVAAWSQFVRWGHFRRAGSKFEYHSLMMELDIKLNGLAKAHKQSDLIEISLSLELTNQLRHCLDEMGQYHTIKFSEIRFYG